MNTAEWGRVNNDWKILKGKTFYNDWTTSDTQTVFGQQSQALEIKDILQWANESTMQIHKLKTTPDQPSGT